MKKLFFLVLLLSNFLGYTQYTLIPDAVFEQALIYKGIDSGAIDGKVLTANVNRVTHLEVFNIDIIDLTGIQDFVSLTFLECSNNQLTSLDVTKNIALVSLSCHGNNLTSMDVTKNIALTYLDCATNNLTNLDVSKNIALTYLDCWANQLTTLDVSKNTDLNHLNCFENNLNNLDVSKNNTLIHLDCSGNQLTILDVSKNTFLTYLWCISNQLTNLNLKNGSNIVMLNINFISNPNLICIQVDNKTYSNTNWSIKKDATARYSEDCSATISAPTISSTIPASRCDIGTVTLGAVTSDGIINWYNVPNGGTSLATGTFFTTPNITNTTKYYVDATEDNYTTPTRTEIIATVNTTPTISSTTPASRCDTGTVTLEATTSNGIINWYSVSTGGISLGTGTSFTTPSINTTSTFYVDATDTNCPSPRIAVIATVFPVATKNEEVILCESETVTLDASISGMNYLWSPGGETSQTIVVSSPGNYSVITSSPSVICNSKKDIKVVEHKNAIIKNITVDENSITIELNNPENYYEFSIDGNYFQDSNQFTHIPSGQYTAFVRAKYLCDIVQQDFTIFTIAKYFTPNNDRFNDVWEIKEMKNYPESSALIFDRYGKLIKCLISSSPFWDGTYNNVTLPADDYWYLLKLDDSKPELKGHFSLKR